MDKFCKVCGAELRNNASFCHKCGAAQKASSSNVMDDTNDNSVRTKESIKTKNPNNIKKYIGVFALIVLFLAKGYAALHAGSGTLERIKGALNIGTAQVTTENKSSTPKNVSSAKEPSTVNPVASQAESELKQHGIQGKIVATSKGHSNSGYVSVVNNNGKYQIVTYDIKNSRIGVTPYDKNLLYFTEKKTQNIGQEHVIFNMTILHDSADRDSEAGAWENGNHNLPIFAIYKFDSAGNLIPGMLTTGKGVKPSHYQGYFNEVRNVDIINLFLTEMMALQKNIADNSVVLP